MTAPVDDRLRALHDAHARELYLFVLRLTRDHGLAQDVVQETLVRAWRHPEVLARSDDSARAWMFTVARHLVVDDRRSARHRHELAVDAPADLPGTSRRDETQSVLDAWLVSDALATLSPEHRAVVVGAYYGGRSVAELAAEHEVPEGTVKSRMHYAMRALRLALQERGVSS
jgi:RNA polymerase sigma-70 factor (ECF subfamily)